MISGRAALVSGNSGTAGKWLQPLTGDGNFVVFESIIPLMLSFRKHSDSMRMGSFVTVRDGNENRLEGKSATFVQGFSFSFSFLSPLLSFIFPPPAAAACNC